MGETVLLWPALMEIAWATTSNVSSVFIGIVANDIWRDWNNGGLNGEFPIVRIMLSIGISGSKIWFI